jgi:Terminase large subunit, T4likevirus-type, N-terminal
VLIARNLAHTLDPALFAEACGITCDPWQAEFLRSDSKRTLQLAARQVGKTTVTSLKAFHVATHEPGSLIVVVAPAERQSKEFVRGVRLLHKNLDDAVPLVGDSVTKMEFENESRILALPGGEEGKTIRGLAGARLVILDEAAQIPDSLLAVVRPMMATNPRAELIGLSTPFGKRGWFYDAWTGGDPVWSRVKVTVDMCPRITPAFLDEERRALGQTMFESEYGLVFHEDSAAMFPNHIIDSLFNTELRALWT